MAKPLTNVSLQSNEDQLLDVMPRAQLAAQFNKDVSAKLTIIIPTYNEVQAITPLLQRLHELYPLANVIVADDNSQDGTQSAVAAFSSLLKYDSTSAVHGQVTLLDRAAAEVRGLSVSVLDAVRICSTEYFLVMDGDLQHPPEAVADVIRTLNEQPDLVVCCRLPFRNTMPFYRLLISKSATVVAKLVLRIRGYKVADPMSGFFAVRTDLVTQLLKQGTSRFELSGYKILFDLLKALPKGLKLLHVDYQFQIRPAGASKFGMCHALCFCRSLFR